MVRGRDIPPLAIAVWRGKWCMVSVARAVCRGRVEHTIPSLGKAACRGKWSMVSLARAVCRGRVEHRQGNV